MQIASETMQKAALHASEETKAQHEELGAELKKQAEACWEAKDRLRKLQDGFAMVRLLFWQLPGSELQYFCCP